MRIVAFTVLYEVPSLAQAVPGTAHLAYVNPKATGPHLHVQRRKGTTWPPPDAADEGRRA